MNTVSSKPWTPAASSVLQTAPAKTPMVMDKEVER
jgi:hypothetical protein